MDLDAKTFIEAIQIAVEESIKAVGLQASLTTRPTPLQQEKSRDFDVLMGLLGRGPVRLQATWPTKSTLKFSDPLPGTASEIVLESRDRQDREQLDASSSVTTVFSAESLGRADVIDDSGRVLAFYAPVG